MRPSSIVIRTAERLVPGEVIDLEFRISGEGPMRLIGVVKLERENRDWTIALIEQSDGYRELCESLTLMERAAR